MAGTHCATHSKGVQKRCFEIQIFEKLKKHVFVGVRNRSSILTRITFGTHTEEHKEEQTQIQNTN